MLKYLKRQKSRHRSCENDDAANITAHDGDVAKKCSQSNATNDSGSAAASDSVSFSANDKRNSLRSTSSFCDEVYLEELATAEPEEDAVSCGAGSLRSFVSAAGIGSSFNEDIFKYNSRLSMSLPTIVNDPICLSYFVQYLERKNDLPLIKFYMDIENFKTAARSQIEKEQIAKSLNGTKLLSPADNEDSTEAANNREEDEEEQKEKEKQNQDQENASRQTNEDDHLAGTNRRRETNDVPELKTLCDLSMRKSITDDEKSQIYAETNKHINKCLNNNNDKTINITSSNNNNNNNNNDININNYNKKNLTNNENKAISPSFGSHFCLLKNDLSDGSKRSSQLSLNSSSNESTITNQESSQSAVSFNVSAASVKDVIAIYQKYLNSKSSYFVNLPIGILSQISLLVCKKNDSLVKTEKTKDLNGPSNNVTINCFDEAQDYALKELELKHLNGFLQSSFYSRYCCELIENRVTVANQSQGVFAQLQQEQLNICDVLYSEVTLFFLMEYLEQQGERECLDFWTAAINFRKTFTSMQSEFDEDEAQSDAMIIYEKFFSLQAENRLWSSERLRTWVEERICASGQVVYCFDLPLKVIAKYLDQKYLNDFLKSPLIENYLKELKMKTKDEQSKEQKANSMIIVDTKNMQIPNGCGSYGNAANGEISSPIGNPLLHKLSLRRARSSPLNQNRHRKTLSDCSAENIQNLQTNSFSAQKNIMYSMMDSVKNELSSSLTMPSIASSATPTKSSANSSNFVPSVAATNNLHIDSSQLNNPNLLWQRSYSSEGGLKFGRVNSLGRYERDFDVVDGKHSWSFSSGGNKIKNAMRKLVNLPEDKVQEEIAWQVAEMIIKDVTSVTIPNADNIPAQAL